MNDTPVLNQVLRMVHEILDEIRQMKRHRNMLGGTPILEFNEVCAMLHLSERQVRRLRETGQLEGFVFNRRRMYSLEEVTAFIKQVEREAKAKCETENN